jgi:hypothetical protein
MRLRSASPVTRALRKWIPDPLAATGKDLHCKMGSSFSPFLDDVLNLLPSNFERQAPETWHVKPPSRDDILCSHQSVLVPSISVRGFLARDVTLYDLAEYHAFRERNRLFLAGKTR